ncbi:MAG: hypothetical protein GY842_16910 [bacterium]|nr:hypothetical protein [bacterium]
MSTLILAAYGSSSSGCISEKLRSCAVELGALGRFEEVTTAFHRGTPSFCDVLAGLSAGEVIIVPLLTSAGHTYQDIMPREMGLSGSVTRREGQTIRVTSVLGEHPRVTQAIGELARQALVDHGPLPEATSLVLVGHGTGYNPDSAAATMHHVQLLQRDENFTETIAVFLNQPPRVEQAFALTSAPTLVVIPNLLGGSLHVTRDIPARLSVPMVNQTYPPPPAQVHGRRVILTRSPYEVLPLAEVVLDLVAQLEESPGS